MAAPIDLYIPIYIYTCVCVYTYACVLVPPLYINRLYVLPYYLCNLRPCDCSCADLPILIYIYMRVYIYTYHECYSIFLYTYIYIHNIYIYILICFLPPGLATVAAPVYLGEIADTSVRGLFSSIYTYMCMQGLCVFILCSADGSTTQRATNYTARSNIESAQIFLRANGQSAP